MESLAHKEELHREAVAIGSFNRHMKNKRRNIYIALEELNFVWDECEVEEFKQLWREGADFTYMSKHFNRCEDELAILLIDLSRKNQLRARDFGLWSDDSDKTGA